jgi:hypothetical protein
VNTDPEAAMQSTSIINDKKGEELMRKADEKKGYYDDNSLNMAVSSIKDHQSEFHSNKVLMSTMSHIVKILADDCTAKSLTKANLVLTAMEASLNDKRSITRLKERSQLWQPQRSQQNMCFLQKWKSMNLS